MDYNWAKNKLKMARAISFVNAGLGVQIVSDEKREQMVKEYYLQVGGALNDLAPSKRGRPKKDETAN